jgi:hypothetical protein
MEFTMGLDEIMEMWSKDSEIDRTELGEESLRIPQLHSKYYKLFSQERLRLRKMESELKVLKLDKYEFYTQGPTEDTPPEWRLPPRGMLLKADVPMYMEADKDIIDLTLKLSYQQEKVDYLENAVKSLVNRNWNIRNAIEWHRFTHGG